MKTIYDQFQSGERKFVKIEPAYVRRYTENITVQTSFFWETSRNNQDYMNRFAKRITNGAKLPRYLIFEVTDKGLVELVTGAPIVSLANHANGIGVFYTNDEIIYKIKDLEEFKRSVEEYNKLGFGLFSEIYMDFCKKANIYKQKRDQKIIIMGRHK